MEGGKGRGQYAEQQSGVDCAGLTFWHCDFHRRCPEARRGLRQEIESG
jgi:hypothetical protein